MREKNRQNHKLLTILLPAAAFLLLAAVLVYGNVWLIHRCNEQDRERTSLLAGILRTECPELSDAQILKLLSDAPDQSSDTAGQPDYERAGRELLQRYGYDEYYFDSRNRELRNQLLILNAGASILFFCILLLLWFLYRKNVFLKV